MLSQYVLAIDEPFEYARLYLEGNMQIWLDAEDSLELWYFFSQNREQRQNCNGSVLYCLQSI